MAHPRILGDIRDAADTALTRAVGVAARNPSMAKWRRRRFFAAAREFAPIVAVDDDRGHRFFVRTDDGLIGQSIMNDGGFDVQPLRAALDVVEQWIGGPITTVLDIGANIGTATVEILADRPDARGYAFEPEPGNCDLFEMNIAANNLRERVTLHRVALTDRDGPIMLELADDNFGDHRVRSGPAEPGALGEEARPTVEIPGRRFDSLGIPVDRSTLVHMDVQGHEASVLAGAPSLAGSPLVVEFWPYALERAGGREALIEQLGRYGRLLNIRAERPVEISVDDLRGASTDWQHMIDLVALP